MTHSPENLHLKASEAASAVGTPEIPMPEIPDDVFKAFEEAYDAGTVSLAPELLSGDKLGAGAIDLARRALADVQDPAA